MKAGDVIAFVSLIVASIALTVAWYAIWRGNRTASAAIVVALNENFRASWIRYGEADDKDKEYELGELLNLFEIACGIYEEDSLTGNSRVLMREYMAALLNRLINDGPAEERISKLLMNKDTFEFIRVFLNRRHDQLSVTIPPKWYEHS